MRSTLAHRTNSHRRYLPRLQAPQLKSKGLLPNSAQSLRTPRMPMCLAHKRRGLLRASYLRDPWTSISSFSKAANRRQRTPVVLLLLRNRPLPLRVPLLQPMCDRHQAAGHTRRRGHPLRVQIRPIVRLPLETDHGCLQELTARLSLTERNRDRRI